MELKRPALATLDSIATLQPRFIVVFTHIRNRRIDLRTRPHSKSAFSVKRFPLNPIIRPEMLPVADSDNINGPSLIRAPEWLPRRLGTYYLYFAHHRGSYIRLAFADRLEGPWTIYESGTLHLSQVPSCRDHIASPDVHVDHARRQIRMYFHGCLALGEGQKSFVATSSDGISFQPCDEVLGIFYLRMAPLQTEWIGMAKGGVMYRSQDGLTKFHRLPVTAFLSEDPDGHRPGGVRHVALQVTGFTLFVYFTRIGDAPECILRSRIDLEMPEEKWTAIRPELVLRPEASWEGATLPLRASKPGKSTACENAVRDPAIFLDDGRLFLLYSVAGEFGIAIAELVEEGV